VVDVLDCPCDFADFLPQKTKKDKHLTLLHDFITANSFAFVLLLSSLDAANQDDAQLL